MPADPKGLERITELVKLATDTIREGKLLVEIAKQAWTKIESTYQTGLSAISDIETIAKGKLSDKIQAAMQVVEKIQAIKASITSIYEDAGKMKEKAAKILENCKELVAELRRWESIKKEIEDDLKAMKLEIVKSIATCWKLANQVYKKAEGELKGLLDRIGKLDLSTITVQQIDGIVKDFEKVMTNYDWITWGGEADVKDLKKAIAANVTGTLKKMLQDAANYVLQSKAWKQVQDLEKAISDLRQEITSIFEKSKTEESLKTVALANKVEEWSKKAAEWAGEKAAQVLGPIVQVAGPAFEFVKKFIKVYKIASDVIKAVDTFPEGLDSLLPHKFEHTFIDREFEFFSYSLSIPIASMGWISLNAVVGIGAKAYVNVKGNLTIYNVFSPKEFKILDGEVTATGKITLWGEVGLSVDLLAIVEFKATAKLEAELDVKQLQAKLELFKKLKDEESKGGLELRASAKITFGIYGSLTFSVGLTSGLRKLVKFFTGVDPVKTWNTERVELFVTEFSKEFYYMLKFKAVDIDFAGVVQSLKDFASYRLSPKGRFTVERDTAKKLGRRDQWENEARGGKLTEQEIENLKQSYGMA